MAAESVLARLAREQRDQAAQRSPEALREACEAIVRGEDPPIAQVRALCDRCGLTADALRSELDRYRAQQEGVIDLTESWPKSAEVTMGRLIDLLAEDHRLQVEIQKLKDQVVEVREDLNETRNRLRSSATNALAVAQSGTQADLLAILDPKRGRLLRIAEALGGMQARMQIAPTDEDAKGVGALITIAINELESIRNSSEIKAVITVTESYIRPLRNLRVHINKSADLCGESLEKTRETMTQIINEAVPAILERIADEYRETFFSDLLGGRIHA